MRVDNTSANDASSTAPVPGASDAPFAESTAPGTQRDSFLDAVKAIAIARVIAWHTWSWWWLSWIGAMPAMFFATGALLVVSVERHGYVRTGRTRLRRLLVPFWWYSACAVTVMLALGWRPGLADLAPWILPLGDPVGSSRTPGLWIPLWYLRAYLWFLLAAPLLRWALAVFGRAALVVPVLATLALWTLQRSGTDVPLAVGDFAAYSLFVLVGMLYVRGLRPSTRATALGGAIAFLAAVVWCVRYGPTTSIVNSSYPLVLLVGTATLAALFLASPLLGDLRGCWGRLVRAIGRRALTIYLWQGFGLLAADELVRRQGYSGPIAALAAIAIVVTVTVAAVAAFGWIEDFAARRPIAMPTSTAVPLVLVALVLLGGAARAEPAAGTAPDLTPSGRAVLAREDFNETVDSADVVVFEGTTQERVDAAFDAWRSRNADVLADLGTQRIEIAVATGEGEDLDTSWIIDGHGPDDDVVAWWSISKLVTGAWLAQLAADGVVDLDAPVSDYLDDIPHGDEITLGQLARHQSGISSGADAPHDASHPRDDLQRYFDNAELVFEPGEGFEYTRVAYYLLTWALEEASGTSWRDVVDEWSDRSGSKIVVDEDVAPLEASSHPGDRPYRGRLWASGGLGATRSESANFFRWVLAEGINAEARSHLTAFSTRDFSNSLGLGIAPLCPCGDDREWRRANRYGADSSVGTWAFDESSGSAVFMTADVWFRGGPDPIFFQLLHDVLDAVGTAPETAR